MRLLDAVVFVGALNPLNQHHRAATEHLSALASDPEVFVSASTLLELDLLFKARGYTCEERYRTWLELSPKIPAEKIIGQTATSLAVASELESGNGLLRRPSNRAVYRAGSAGRDRRQGHRAEG